MKTMIFSIDIIISILNLILAIVFIFIIYLIGRKILSLTKIKNINIKTTVAYTMSFLCWYFLSMILSINGFFRSPVQYSKNDYLGITYIIILLILPILIFLTTLRKVNSFKELLSSFDLKFLIGLQTYRLFGAYFLLLFVANRAPLMFALLAGIGDTLVGISAIFLRFKCSSNSLLTIKTIKVWNYFGLIDIIIAVVTYFLYYPFFILKVPPEMIMWAGFYPVSFIAIFVVPLSVILHILVIRKLS